MTAVSPTVSRESAKVYHVPLDVWVISGAEMSCFPKTTTRTPTGHTRKLEYYLTVTFMVENMRLPIYRPTLKLFIKTAYVAYVQRISFHLLTDRQIDLLTTDKMSNVEPIRRKLPKGKKLRRKKYGRVTPDQREALIWSTGAQVFEVLIKIHTE